MRMFISMSLYVAKNEYYSYYGAYHATNYCTIETYKKVTLGTRREKSFHCV